MRDVPLCILITTVWAYWLGVAAMVVRVRRRNRRPVGIVPEQRRERFMWLIWAPLVSLWVALPVRALNSTQALLALPSFARDNEAYATARGIAAALAVAALALTVICWLRMGDDWRMDVGARKTALITDGLFARVRHPIYALSMLLMVCSLIIVPTWAMGIIAAVHLTLMNLKARNEETHLAQMHGESYVRYMEQTGRFVPRLSTRTQ